MIPQLIHLLVYLLVIGIVLALVIWVVQSLPIPEPFGNIIRVVAMVICALIVILLLLQLAGIATAPPLP